MEPAKTSGQEASQRLSPIDYVIGVGCFVPTVAALGLVSWGAASLLHSLVHLPMWLSIPLGLVVGATFIGLLKCASDSTWVEFSMTSVIIVILFLILIPVFRQARERARWQRQRAARSALGTSGGAHFAGPPVSARSGTGR